jgi:hypothetical protein
MSRLQAAAWPGTSRLQPPSREADGFTDSLQTDSDLHRRQQCSRASAHIRHGGLGTLTARLGTVPLTSVYAGQWRGCLSGSDRESL